MLLLDTNVLSALMTSPPQAQVVAWLDRQDLTDLWTSTITVHEISYGLARLPEGKRRAGLVHAFSQMCDIDFEGRIAPFDADAAAASGALMALRDAIGRPIETADAMIAGIAIIRSAALITRNLRDFEGLGVPLVNPWED